MTLHAMLARTRQVYFWKCLNWAPQDDLDELKCDIAELEDLIEIDNERKQCSLTPLQEK